MSGFVSHPDLVNPLTGPTPVGLVEATVQPPAEQPPANPEPAEGDIATSKYGEDLSALRKGYNEQFTEVQSRILPELRELREQNKLLMEKFMAANPPTTQRDPDIDELTTLGIPVQAIERIIERVADRRVESRLEPLARFAKAQSEIAAEIPNYTEVAPQVQKFLAGNPVLAQEINELASLNPKAAAKYAFREWEASQPRQRVSAADTGLNKTNASIPTNNSMGARASAERDFQRELSTAEDHYRQTGDDRPFWRVWNEMQGGVMHPSFGQPPG